MKNSSVKLSLEELEIESFVTGVDASLSHKIAGGFGMQSHPTHTEVSDPLHPDECTCPSVLQESGF
ncbi:pinensin family lanthipeptide [Olivibacter jilunii]|uniref:pinensin family lanthipeptide n=1 Tax=Olivibacter jilunii TaxID=985016 RepID=UPI003F13F728